MSIDKDAQRVSVSYRLTKENLFEFISKNYGMDKIIECAVTEKIENGILVRIPETDVDAFYIKIN